MNQSPADILAAIKASVDKMVEETQARIALVAATIQGLPDRVARLETLLIALLELKADQPLPALVSPEERERREQIVRQFADLQTDVEARSQ